VEEEEIYFMKKRLVFVVLALLLASLACQAAGGGGATSEPAIPPEDILLQDDFSDINSGFPQDRSDGGVADYEDGGYRIFVNIDNTYYWGHPDKLMNMDVKVEVDAKVLGGPENNEYGVICRHLTDEEYYYFTVSSQGYAIIGKLNADGYTTLAEEQTNGMVNPGSETNHLTAICKGSDLTFLVNGKQALTAKDSEITLGDVGLIAGTYDEPNVDVMFDNLLVTVP
jgi:hypothetical protein